MGQEQKLKREIVLLGKFLYERGWLVATDGNISVRLKKAILITPRGRCKGEISVGEISKVSLQGKILSGQPSSEWQMHFGIYKKREDVRAIIHAHPLFATLVFFWEKDLDLSLLPEAEIHLREIRFISDFKPGSRELAEAVSKGVSENPGCDIFILKRHGVVVFGKDLQDARFKLERLEFFSHFFWLVKGRE